MIGFITSIISLALIIMIPILLIGLTCTVIIICSLWKIFKKAGKQGWEAIIPGYNIAILCEITGFTPYLGFIALGLLIPVIDSIAFLALIVLYGVNCWKLTQAFGKQPEYLLGLIFLPVVFLPMLAFDDNAKYNHEYMYKGVGFSNYTNGSNNANNNTFYAENLNKNQETQEADKEDTNSNPVQDNDDNNTNE